MYLARHWNVISDGLLYPEHCSTIYSKGTSLTAVQSGSGVEVYHCDSNVEAVSGGFAQVLHPPWTFNKFMLCAI